MKVKMHNMVLTLKGKTLAYNNMNFRTYIQYSITEPREDM